MTYFTDEAPVDPTDHKTTQPDELELEQGGIENDLIETESGFPLEIEGT